MKRPTSGEQIMIKQKEQVELRSRDSNPSLRSAYALKRLR